ncbi:MAG: Gfo/Idh/MocA family oxidoreductase, partial [bacterium]|nr:Gfo/Idh/MocA family oxidoreductase [bacterium]
SLKKIKRLIAERTIGTVQSVRVQKVFTQAADGWKAGYGALLEGGIHFVALISDLFDAAPEQVEGIFPDGKVVHERHSVTRMTYAGGVLVELHYAWNVKSLTKGVFQHSQIVGDEGKIVFESNGMYLYVRGKHRSGIFFPGFKDLMGTKRMISDFLHCLEEAARLPYSDFEKAKRDLGVVFQAYGMA